MSEDLQNSNYKLNEFEIELNKLISKEIDKLEDKLQQKILNNEKKREANSLLILSNIQTQNEKLSKIEKNFKNSKILIISTITLFIISLFLTFISLININNINNTLSETKKNSEELLSDVSNKAQIALSTIKDSKSIYITQKDLEYYHNELNHTFSTFARGVVNNHNSNIEKLNEKIEKLESELGNYKVKSEVKKQININLKELIMEYFSLTIDKFETIEEKLKVKFVIRLYDKLTILPKREITREKILKISKLYLKKIFYDFKYIKINSENLNSDLTFKTNFKTSNFLKKIDEYLNN